MEGGNYEQQQQQFSAPPSFEFPGAMDFLGLDTNEDLSSVSSSISSGNPQSQSQQQQQQQQSNYNNDDWAIENSGYIGFDDITSNSSLTPDDFMQPFEYNTSNPPTNTNFDNGSGSGFFNNNNNNTSTNSPLSSPSGSINSSYNSDHELRPNYIPQTTTTNDRQQQSSENNNNMPVTPPYLSYIKEENDDEHEDFDDDTRDLDYYLGSATGSSTAVSSINIKQEPISPPHPDTTITNTAANSAKHAKKNSNSHGNIGTKNNKVSKPKKEKTSHNMIEKRYRTNINEKILALRDCVPSLRCVVDGSPTAEKDLDGLTPASRLNKATVLTKATEYILHLQSKNDSLLKEVSDLRSMMNNHPLVANQHQQQQYPPVQDTSADMNQFNAYPQQQPQFKSQAASKFMLCSMAGLMGAGMMQDSSSTPGDSRGLYALPLVLSSGKVHDISGVLHLLRVSMIIATVVYIVAPYLMFNKKDGKQQKLYEKAASEIKDATNNKHSRTSSSSTSPSASSIRKEVWNINCKRLGLPNFAFSSLKEYSVIDKIVGWTYTFMVTFYQVVGSFVNNKTTPAEYTTALSRAIDAQLCGGDINSNILSLLITFLKSLSLSPSSKRQMRQAVHVKILVNNAPHWIKSIGHNIAISLWTKAKKRADITAEEMNSHYKFLLQTPEILSDEEIMDRITKFAFGNFNGYYEQERKDEGYISVVEDQVVRSAVDSMAAWYACKLKNEVMVEHLEEPNEPIDLKKLNRAVNLSPPNSIVRRRVAVVEALLLGPKDGQYINTALSLINDEMGLRMKGNQLINTDYADEPPMIHSSSSKQVIPTDCKLAIHCSIILYYYARKQNDIADKLLKQIKINPSDDIELLGFVALWLTVNQASKVSKCYNPLEKCSTAARVWIGTDASGSRLSLQKRRELVGKLLKFSAKFGGYSDNEIDEGYYSEGQHLQY